MPTAIFVETVPFIEIEDGLVHITWGENKRSYWKPSTFRAFVEAGRRELDAWERQASHVVPFRGLRSE